MILLIDNYDSFAYNLYQIIGSINPDIEVIRNNAMSVDKIDASRPDAIIISPGPGRPKDAGVSIETVQKLGSRYPILGVCLGHQSICEAYGATVSYAQKLMHGKQCKTCLDTDCILFRDLPDIVQVARYHSLAVIENTIPGCLQITARAEDGEIMGVKHREYNVFGVQFHPESIMTPDGPKMLRNFLDLVR